MSRILSIPVKQNTQKTVFNTSVDGRFRLVIINVFFHVLKSFPCLLIYFVCSFSDFLFCFGQFIWYIYEYSYFKWQWIFSFICRFFFLLSPTRRLPDLTIYMSNIVLAFCVVLFCFVCFRPVSRVPNVVDVSVLTLLVYPRFFYPQQSMFVFISFL